MKDKITAYKSNGYNVKLIVDFNEVDINSL